MYEAHFGLTCRPFRESVDPSLYVSLPSREAALRRMRYGLEYSLGPVLMYGPSGAGKTILGRVLAERLGRRSVHLTFPAMPAAELMAFLADEIGAPPAARGGIAGSVKRLQTALAAAVSRQERLLLVVDEAHLIDDVNTFEALRLLLNFSTEGPPDLDLVLIAAPEILLHIPSSLADRLTAQSLAGVLSEDESAAYVEGRLAAAGAVESLFAVETLAMLHRASDGIPRRLNRLADLALLITYADELSRPNRAIVELAAREMEGGPLVA